jgi:aminoglycoside 6'-N-acetyltransferase I
MSDAIRPSNPGDHAEWLRMRLALWPEVRAAEHRDDMQAWLGRADAVVIVAAAEPGLCGFIEVGTRSVADGCDTSPVAYVEGWYVDAGQRGRGVGAALMRAAERWAIQQGHRELASDTQLSNIDSQHAHAALGFTEVERAVLFVKKLAPIENG